MVSFAAMGRSSALLVLLPSVLAGCVASAPAGEAPAVVTPSVTLGRAQAIEGRALDVAFRFDVAPDAPALTEDYTVFVHVRDVDYAMIGTDEHAPPEPTSRWRAGSTVEYTHTMFVPETGYVGPVTLEVGLYLPGTDARLPVGGEVMYDMRVTRVAALEILPEPDPVEFLEGWHERESPPAAASWRWSMKAGVLGVTNPRTDAVLTLVVDQPHKDFPVDQHVDVMIGPQAVDGFELPVGHTMTRVIPLTVEQLGQDDEVHLLVLVDKTFVLADDPAFESHDTRQLGLRLFYAYLETNP